MVRSSTRSPVSGGKLIAGLLAAGLIGQIIIRYSGVTSGDVQISDITIHAPFPVSLLNLKTGDVAALPTGCWVAYVIHPECASCGTLAKYRGPLTGRGGDLNLLWISVGGAHQTARFASDHNLPEEWVFRVPGGKNGRDLSLLFRLGLGGVPTRLLLSHGGAVSEILMTHEVPVSAENNDLCWPAAK